VKAEIDLDGHLWIMRGGIRKPQTCPHASSEGGSEYCGDWCPLFEENHWKDLAGVCGHEITLNCAPHLTTHTITEDARKEG
jgi:hypothetical protein